MKLKKLIVILVLWSQVATSQSSLVAETIDHIDFGKDTIESVFLWITDNIRYDIRKLNDIKKSDRLKNNTGFSSEEAYKQHLLERVINQRKGVCEDYALLFDEIVKELGYASYIVEGYTKDPDGNISQQIGHAWNAIKVGQKWKLYDATWGSGSVRDGKRFIKKFNSQWYDVEPKEMLESHMPFDPLWQLLNEPITYSQFDRKSSVHLRDRGAIDYAVVDAFVSKDMKLQMEEMVARSDRLGSGIGLINRWKKVIASQINYYGLLSQEDLMEEAFDGSNRAVAFYNKFVTAQRSRFQGKQMTRRIARQHLQAAKDEIEQTIRIYTSIEVNDRGATKFINKSVREANKLLQSINSGIELVNRKK